MWSYALAVWGVRLPLSWWLGHVVLRSSAGVYWAMIASQLVQCAMLLWVLLRVDWKRFALGSSRPGMSNAPRALGARGRVHRRSSEDSARKATWRTAEWAS